MLNLHLNPSVRIWFIILCKGSVTCIRHEQISLLKGSGLFYRAEYSDESVNDVNNYLLY